MEFRTNYVPGISLSTLYTSYLQTLINPRQDTPTTSLLQRRKEIEAPKGHTTVGTNLGSSPVCSDSKVCDLSSYHGLIKKRAFCYTLKEAELECRRNSIFWEDRVCGLRKGPWMPVQQEEAGLLAKHPGLKKVDWLSISWVRDHNFVSISYLPSLALEVQACLYPSPWLSFSSCSVHPILDSNSQN